MSNPFLTITCPDKDGFIKGDIYDRSLSKMQGFMRPSVRRKGDIADNLRQISRLTSHRDVSNTGLSDSDHSSSSSPSVARSHHMLHFVSQSRNLDLRCTTRLLQ